MNLSYRRLARASDQEDNPHASTNGMHIGNEHIKIKIPTPQDSFAKAYMTNLQFSDG